MNYRIAALITLISCCAVESYGQFYNRVLINTNGHEALSTVQVINNHLFCYGQNLPFNQGGYLRRYIAQLEFNGDTNWTKTYFNDTSVNFYTAYPKQPIVTDNHMYVCSCNEITSGYCVGALMNLDMNGDTIWTKDYDFGSNSTFSSMSLLSNGDLFIAGRTDMGSYQANVIRMDSSGNIKWQYFIGGGGDETIFKADTLSSSRYLISGNTSSIGAGQNDVWMCIIDSAGNFVSQRTFGYAYNDGGWATVINADTILLHGFYRTPPNPIAQKRVGFVILCDANLNFLDTLTVEGPDQTDLNNFFGAIENKRNEYVLIGNIYDYDQLPRAPIGHLICLDKNLNLKWERKFKAREASNYPSDIALMPDGGYIISGYVFPGDPGTTQDGWLVRTNCLGWLSKPIPQFTAFNTGNNTGNNTVRFHNYSKFAEKYTWDFGDGWQYTHATSLQDSLSSVPYVEHTYTTPGTYTATLYAIACGDTMTITQTIVADPVSVSETNKENIKVYPNPTGGNAFIESPTLANYHTLQVFNDAGQWVYSSSITPNATNRLEIPSSTWANGIYVLTLEGAERVEKVVLMKTE